MSTARVLFVTNYATPYQVSLFGQAPLIEACRVVSYAEIDSRRTWGSEGLPPNWEVLPGNTARRLARIVRHVLSSDAILVGGSLRKPVPALTLVLALLTQRRVHVWLERPKHVSRVDQVILRSMASLGVRVLAVGRLAQEAYRVLLGQARDKVDMFPYSYGAVSPMPPSRPDIADARLELLIVGSEPSRKGFDIAIEACGALAVERPLRLTIAGRFPDFAVPSFVNAVGGLAPSDLRGQLAQSHILLVPSRFDGWAVIIEEAFAAGVPAIVFSEVGAVGTLASDGHGCLVVDELTAEAFANAVLDVVSSVETYGGFAASAGSSVEHFRRRYNASSLLDLLSGVSGSSDDAQVI